MRSAAGAMFAALWSAIGCAEGDCALEPARVELTVSAPSTLSGRIGSLAVEVMVKSERRWKIYELHGELADGTTSLEVILDGAPALSFELGVWIAAYERAGAEGSVLARGGEVFMAAPNACNRFTVALGDREPPIGGELDAGAGLETDAEPTDLSDAAEPMENGGGKDAGVHEEQDAETAIDAEAPIMAECNPPDSNDVALYNFDNDVGSSSISDAVGAHRGRLVGTGTSWVPGPPGCGRALGFSSNTGIDGYGLVPDSLAWDLDEGSVDFWMKLGDQPPRTRQLGLIARDMDGDGRGRFSVRSACDGTIVAKLEYGQSGVAYQCSNAPVQLDRWSHVEVRFGPSGFELLLDDVRQTRTGTVGLLGIGCAETVFCGTSATAGLIGNIAPWVIGADARDLQLNGMTGLDAPFVDGVIDHLRIRGR